VVGPLDAAIDIASGAASLTAQWNDLVLARPGRKRRRGLGERLGDVRRALTIAAPRN